jgi:hypothetical protein
MRVDALALELDTARSQIPRPQGSILGAPSPLPAAELLRHQVAGFRRTGIDVAGTYGCLVHYTTTTVLQLIEASNQIGRPGGGLWLSPHPYAECMLPINLGLDDPRDVALVVDVRSVPELWGPGRAAASRRFPAHWRGGGLEFYVPQPVPLASTLVDVIRLEPCGDRHR